MQINVKNMIVGQILNNFSVLYYATAKILSLDYEMDSEGQVRSKAFYIMYHKNTIFQSLIGPRYNPKVKIWVSCKLVGVIFVLDFDIWSY